MPRYIHGTVLGTEIAKRLGIKPDKVKSMTINIQPDEVVTLNVVILPDYGDIELFHKYNLVEAG